MRLCKYLPTHLAYLWIASGILRSNRATIQASGWFAPEHVREVITIRRKTTCVQFHRTREPAAVDAEQVCIKNGGDLFLG